MNDATTNQTVAELTFSDPAVQRCPLDAYKALRHTSPVYLDPVTGTYVLTRYDDIMRVLLDSARFSNRTGLGVVRESLQKSTIDAIYEKSGGAPVPALLDLDPPEHRRHRTLVDRMFAPARIAQLEPGIDRIILSLIESISVARDVEFVSEFAEQLPMQVITEILGLPMSDAPLFKLWSACSLENQGVTLTLEREVYVATQLAAMRQYFRNAIDRVRAAPDGSLLSVLVQAEQVDEGAVVNIGELVSILHQLLVAGNETTVIALTNAMKILLDEPQIAIRLKSNPAEVPKFVEESLRLMTPAQTLFRKATQEVEVQGVRIPAGAIVEVRYGAANSDPTFYPCPERFDLDRGNLRSHLAFSAGIHSCIGSRLARTELCHAIQMLLERFSVITYARASKSVSYSYRYISYSMSELWIRLSNT